MIDQQVNAVDVSSVTLFGHILPKNVQESFFVPLRKYRHENIGNKVDCPDYAEADSF